MYLDDGIFPKVFICRHCSKVSFRKSINQRRGGTALPSYCDENRTDRVREQGIEAPLRIDGNGYALPATPGKAKGLCHENKEMRKKLEKLESKDRFDVNGLFMRNTEK